MALQLIDRRFKIPFVIKWILKHVDCFYNWSIFLDIGTVDTKLLRAIPWDKVQIESGKWNGKNSPVTKSIT